MNRDGQNYSDYRAILIPLPVPWIRTEPTPVAIFNRVSPALTTLSVRARATQTHPFPDCSGPG